MNTGEVLDERELPHDLPKVIKHLLKIEDRHGKIHTCYEASSCGFGLQRALEAHGISCEVVAPSSIPRRPGERVKTDRRDARKLATLYAAGLLTTINIPDEDQEAIRSFLRCRSDLTDTIVRTKQRILAFLLTRGFRYPDKSHWTKMFHTWVRALPMAEMDRTTLHTYLYQLEQLEHEVCSLEADLAEVANEDRYEAPVKVLMAFRGIGLVNALTLIFELGDIRRFAHPRQLMAYLGDGGGAWPFWRAVRAPKWSTKGGGRGCGGDGIARRVLPTCRQSFLQVLTSERWKNLRKTSKK